jgi:hypothetical protein
LVSKVPILAALPGGLDGLDGVERELGAQRDDVVDRRVLGELAPGATW